MNNLQTFICFLDLTGFEYDVLEDPKTGLIYLKSLALGTDKVEVVSYAPLEVAGVFSPSGDLMKGGIDAHVCGVSNTSEEVGGKFNEQ